MIRQFRPGVWIDPKTVVAVDGIDYMVHVMCLIGGRVNRVPIRALDDAHAVALANEIGEAALIAQEARLAAESRSLADAFGPGPAEAGRHMRCPECGSTDRLPKFAEDNAGRSE